MEILKNIAAYSGLRTRTPSSRRGEIISDPSSSSKSASSIPIGTAFITWDDGAEKDPNKNYTIWYRDQSKNIQKTTILGILINFNEDLYIRNEEQLIERANKDLAEIAAGIQIQTEESKSQDISPPMLLRVRSDEAQQDRESAINATPSKRLKSASTTGRWVEFDATSGNGKAANEYYNQQKQQWIDPPPLGMNPGTHINNLNKLKNWKIQTLQWYKDNLNPQDYGLIYRYTTGSAPLNKFCREFFAEVEKEQPDGSALWWPECKNSLEETYLEIVNERFLTSKWIDIGFKVLKKMGITSPANLGLFRVTGKYLVTVSKNIAKVIRQSPDNVDVPAIKTELAEIYSKVEAASNQKAYHRYCREALLDKKIHAIIFQQLTQGSKKNKTWRRYSMGFNRSYML